jgi:nucleotide-binding universal stress UspA family protein
VEREAQIRRVLVALDASPASLAALEVAAELAAALSTELSGLFVEDVNLLRAAELPAARVLGSFSGRPLPLERCRLERELRAEAVRAREALAAVAERGMLRWSFRVARGTVAPEILLAASEAGLVVVGKAGRSMGRLGSTARAVAASARGPAAIVGSESPRGGDVVVLYDGSAAAERALALAARLFPHRNVVVAISPEASRETRSRMLRSGDGLPATRVVELRSGDPRELARLGSRAGTGLLLVPAGPGARVEPALAGLLEEVECPVLLVR